MPINEIWVASANPGKLAEFKILLSHLPYAVHTAAELKNYHSPIENGADFRSNALIKAKSLAALKRECFVLADDSGLEVNGLGGLPGIHSARYAGPKASDMENQSKLLKMMSLRCPLQREARFVCCLCLIDPAGEIHYFEGDLKGSIAKSPKGTDGFGYDPIFIPEGSELTLSELGKSYKIKHSHRAVAFMKLVTALSSTVSSSI